MIYTGGGVILGNAAEQLRMFVSTLGYPVTSTLMGLGSIPWDDQQFLGMLGMHGTYEANMAMHDCDVLIAIGARFDDRVTGKIAEFCPHAKIVHIDIDPSSISKTISVDVPIVGNVADVLNDMNQLLSVNKTKPDQSALTDWWNIINGWRAKKCMSYDRNSDQIKPQAVVEMVHEITNGDAYVTSDVGQHQMWAAQYYGFSKPNRWINSGGLGTMGFGLPAAMGVQLAFPEETVICITGEGSIQMGIRIERVEDLRPKLEEAFAMKDRLVFLDIVTDQTENVYPMIAQGKAHNEMHMSPYCDLPQDPERELS